MLRRAVVVATVLAVMVMPLRARQAPRPSLIDQAVAAEMTLRFNVAIDRLFQIVLEQPRTPDAWPARMQLARLLALAGDWPGALMHCQSLRAELPTPHPLRQQAIDFATLAARRLRGVGAPLYFAGATSAMLRGLPSTDEPNHIEVLPAGGYVLADAGDGRAYTVTNDAATPVPAGSDLATVIVLPDGRTAIADKTGIAIGGARAQPFTGTWGGKARPLKKTRSMAALSGGDLLLIDKDYDGLLRCTTAGACAPWGPPGKLRVVAVGPADFVFTLPDQQQSVRVLDNTGRVAAVIASAAGPKFGEIVDIAVDRAFGLYVLDKETRRLDILALRADRANTLTVVPIGGAVIPNDGDTGLKNPSALGVLPDGSVVIAGRSTTRVLRFQ